MTADPGGDSDPGGDGPTGVAPEGWPVSLRGVTESVVTTRGPNDRWNVAALGLHAPDDPGDPVTARTYGRTRTWRNFAERGGGVVQFTVDPRTFVDAALTVREVDQPVLPSADAWVKVQAEEVAVETEGDTTIRTWELEPVESAVVAERVPTVNRGFGAVVDATVAASRLDVPSFDTGELLDRLRYFADVVERCGGPAEREAFRRIDEATGWRERDRSRGEGRDRS
ncbi:DUF447 domain-containing protein [Halorubrum tebenquichense]|uniref:DUF447 family protein n=1 Tax=Halorubrum tebenquichense DSM 14210 TaxID=1227485 RepID=M0DJ05_9EURY|nr:DUF447 domain-containing protein [Halorubrum tebenquichense]ELZ34798.1 hypothetical protein C472_13002 [Halorubrum tebenquichense DSM 14210]